MFAFKSSANSHGISGFGLVNPGMVYGEMIMVPCVCHEGGAGSRTQNCVEGAEGAEGAEGTEAVEEGAGIEEDDGRRRARRVFGGTWTAMMLGRGRGGLAPTAARRGPRTEGVCLLGACKGTSSGGHKRSGQRGETGQR